MPHRRQRSSDSFISKLLHTNYRGFTLVELAVVVAIIGILAAIAIPTFLGQRNGAHDRRAQSDLINVAIQNRATAASNDAVYVGTNSSEMADVLDADEPAIPVGDEAVGGSNTIGDVVVVSTARVSSTETMYAAMSASGTCWYIYDNMGGGTYFAKELNASTCNASAIAVADVTGSGFEVSSTVIAPFLASYIVDNGDADGFVGPMSAAAKAGVTVTHGGNGFSNALTNVIDGDIGTSNAFGNGNHSLTFDFGGPITLSRITTYVYWPPDTSLIPGVTVQYSDDGVTFTDAAPQFNPPLSARGVNNDYNFDFPTATHRYWKVLFGKMSLSEFDFFNGTDPAEFNKTSGVLSLKQSVATSGNSATVQISTVGAPIYHWGNGTSGALTNLTDNDIFTNVYAGNGYHRYWVDFGAPVSVSSVSVMNGPIYAPYGQVAWADISDEAIAGVTPSYAGPYYPSLTVSSTTSLDAGVTGPHRFWGVSIGKGYTVELDFYGPTIDPVVYEDTNQIYVRVDNITPGPGTTIDSATLTLTVAQVSPTGSTDALVRGVDTPNPAAPVSTADVDGWPLTSASTVFDIANTTAVGTQVSIDVTSIVQELVDNGHASGDAFILLITPQGNVVHGPNASDAWQFESFESSAGMPALDIQWTGP